MSDRPDFDAAIDAIQQAIEALSVEDEYSNSLPPTPRRDFHALLLALHQTKTRVISNRDRLQKKCLL